MTFGVSCWQRQIWSDITWSHARSYRIRRNCQWLFWTNVILPLQPASPAFFSTAKCEFTMRYSHPSESSQDSHLASKLSVCIPAGCMWVCCTDMYAVTRPLDAHNLQMSYVHCLRPGDNEGYKVSWQDLAAPKLRTDTLRMLVCTCWSVDRREMYTKQ